MIYVFGDGFATGHIWPEWPQLLELVADQSVKNYSHIGAGNEYIFNCAIKSLLSATSDDIVLIQWADPLRYDKIIESLDWKELQSQDTIYKDINSEVYNQLWWSTSGSTLDAIKHYKEFYVQPQQAVNRSVLYILSLLNLLDSKNIKNFSFLSYSFDYSSHDNYKDLEKLSWINIGQGMDEWIKENTTCRGDEVQPSTHSQWTWLKANLFSKIEVDQSRISAAAEILNQKTFTAYDPDRYQRWVDIKHDLNI
jgi:hypothetical protein